MNKKNLEIFEFLEANYIPAIKASDDDKVLNEVLFKTVDYLLRNTYELSGNTLGLYDERDKRKIFSSFGKIAQTACDFYRASKKHLDPVALNGEIGQKLETAAGEVKKVNALLESIEKANVDLIKKEKELIAINEEYKKTEENIFRLRKIKETITEAAFKKLKQEHAELDLYFKENNKIAVKLKEYGISRIDDFSVEMDNLKKHVKNELERFDNIIKGVIEELEKQKEDIGRRNKTLN